LGRKGSLRRLKLPHVQNPILSSSDRIKAIRSRFFETEGAIEFRGFDEGGKGIEKQPFIPFMPREP
jgi:hypothetical protein